MPALSNHPQPLTWRAWQAQNAARLVVVLRAVLGGADLGRADLHDANLVDANLQGAHLEGAHNLKQQQLETANGDDQTQLPEGLTRPAHWSKAKAPETPSAPQPDDGRAPAANGARQVVSGHPAPAERVELQCSRPLRR